MQSFFNCANSRIVPFKKDETIIEEGMSTREFGIVLQGRAKSVKWDASDKQVIITLLETGDVIGVFLAASPLQVSPLTVLAMTDVSVLMLRFEGIIAGCEKKCPHHQQLLQDYVAIIAKKGLELHGRINCLLEPTVRKRVLAYLEKISVEQNSREIILPINRNIMAEYLNVERSSLSRELAQMKSDGLIEYKMNRFTLL